MRRLLPFLALLLSLSATGSHAVPVYVTHASGGAGPIAADSFAGAWFVANAGSKDLSILAAAGAGSPAPGRRAGAGLEVLRVALGAEPRDVAIHDRTGAAYVSLSNGQVAVVTGAAISALIGPMTTPWGLAVDAGKERLCIAAFGEDKVWVVDTATRAVVAKVSVNPGPVGVAAGGGFCYVTSYYTGSIQKIDLTSNAVTASALSVPGDAGACPFGIALSADNGVLYVSNQCRSSVSYLFTGNMAVVFVKSLPGSYVEDLAASGRSLFVADSANHRMVVLNAVDPSATTPYGLPTGARPRGVATSATPECAIATNYLSESVTLACEQVL